jgi:hypothetical protein
MKLTSFISSMRKQQNRTRAALHLVVACVLIGGSLNAYPPVPHHRFYGMVRNEYGHPIQTEGAEIIFETSTGRILRSPIADYYPSGTNYRLDVPMDAGLNEALYQPTAMLPDAPFRIRVKIGDEVFLPIEIAAKDASYIGEPGGRTLLNLTLGEDLDGDGLPDAWERSLLQRLHLEELTDVDPNADSDQDGLSNLEEYISGNYAYDDKNGFSLQISGWSDGLPLMTFRAVRGRTYSLLSSVDLEHWEEVSFTVPSNDSSAKAQRVYKAEDVRLLEVRADLEESVGSMVYFKLMVQ